MSSTDKPTVRVVAAVIEREGKYLITQRMPHAVMPLLWEFPGGKVELGETDAVALARELAEEMAIAVHVRDELMAVVQEYNDYVIDFHVYLCDMLSDTIQRVGINDFKWVTSDELDRYPFPAADQATVRALIDEKPN
jgi:8-oxo-dGTP diphosphatase